MEDEVKKIEGSAPVTEPDKASIPKPVKKPVGKDTKDQNMNVPSEPSLANKIFSERAKMKKMRIMVSHAEQGRRHEAVSGNANGTEFCIKPNVEVVVDEVIYNVLNDANYTEYRQVYSEELKKNVLEPSTYHRFNINVIDGNVK